MNRRFVYLLVDDIWQGQSIYPLHRINMSGFFYRTKPGNRSRIAADAKHSAPSSSSVNNTATIEDAQLPRPVITFRPPSSDFDWGRMEFMLFSSHDGNNRIVGTDQRRNVLLYEADSHTIQVLPSLHQRKSLPISLTIGESLYTMDYSPVPSDAKCFEALSPHRATFNPLGRLDWRWRSLPPPPYLFEPSYKLPNCGITSYAVVGDSSSTICMSTEEFGTYSFDTGSHVWSKAGDWLLPFFGGAEYIPEHGLWFGLSYGDDNRFCASDLSVTLDLKPPTLRHVWEWKDDLKPREDWVRGMAYAVHVGSGRFCIARFFETPEDVQCDDVGFYRRESEKFVVLTGVEVERCRMSGELRMVTHRSKRYKLVKNVFGWLL